MNKYKLLRACPICQNYGGAELIHTQKFTLPDNHPLPDKYDVVACDKCGFVYADTFATQETYDRYYAEMSKYDMNYTCADSSLYVERAAWINLFIGDKTNRIIDIGCGNGHLLLELQRLGFSDLTGLDPSEKCVSNLKNKGIFGIVNSIFEVSTNRKYDCAILSGVLEHICDVGRIMGSIKVLLRISGLLFVCVPDASRYQYYDSAPFDYFNIEHINHFDETSLLNLGIQHQFSMIGLLKTTIKLSKTMQPVIFCVYENNGKSAANGKSYSRTCVIDYVEQTNNNTEINSAINRLIETNEEIIIWGAGNFTSRLLANTMLNKCNIVMIVDNDKHKQGTVISGRTVKHPSAIFQMEKMSTILIGATVFCDEIVSEIKGMGLNNKLMTLKKNINGSIA